MTTTNKDGKTIHVIMSNVEFNQVTTTLEHLCGMPDRISVKAAAALTAAQAEVSNLKETDYTGTREGDVGTNTPLILQAALNLQAARPARNDRREWDTLMAYLN